MNWPDKRIGSRMTDFTQRAWDDSGGGLLRQAPDKGIDPSHPFRCRRAPRTNSGDLFSGFLIKCSLFFTELTPFVLFGRFAFVGPQLIIGVVP
jgi:hypothetical protein